MISADATRLWALASELTPSQTVGWCPPNCNNSAPATSNLTIAESGLADGVTWEVSVNWTGGIAVLESNVTAQGAGTIVLSAAPNTYTITLFPVAGYELLTANPVTVVVVEGLGANVLVAYAIPNYTVSFQESGLPGDMNWSVRLNTLHGSNTTDLLDTPPGVVTFTVPNGTYGYSLGLLPAGPSLAFEPFPSTGTVVVSGGSVAVSITFTLVPTVKIAFREAKLPVGASWSVLVWGTASINTTILAGPNSTASKGIDVAQVPVGALSFSIPNVTVGTTTYSLAKIAGPGAPNQTRATVYENTTWTVIFGANRALYFNESSLPRLQLYPGADWRVTLAPALLHGGPPAQSQTTNDPSIHFTVPAGAAYRFAVSIVSPGGSSYKITPLQGGASVPPSKLSVAKIVKFKLLTESVAFEERGLEGGTNWTVTITNGTTPVFAFPLTATKAFGTGAIKFKLPVGTYSYSIMASDSQIPSPASGSLSVLVAPSPVQLILITFN